LINSIAVLLSTLNFLVNCHFPGFWSCWPSIREDIFYHNSWNPEVQMHCMPSHSMCSLFSNYSWRVKSSAFPPQKAEYLSAQFRFPPLWC